MTIEEEKELHIKFAMHAMQGILSNDACMHEIITRGVGPEIVANIVARQAFLYADAMMLKI